MVKRTVLIALLAFYSFMVSGQRALVALEGDRPLSERYSLMKANSQTFQDYKVIKETILDGFWKIVNDSLRTQALRMAEAKAKISQLEEAQTSLSTAAQQKDEAMAEMEFDSSHVTLVGLAVSKALFITTTGIIIIGLLVVVVGTFGALRLSQRLVKEKDLSLYGIAAEFDEFRKKALEKEVKLSRELQNERNRLAELRGAG